MNKKGLAPLALLLILGATIFVIGTNFDILNVASITGGGSYIERPVFKYVKCEQVSSYQWSSLKTLSEGNWITPPETSSSYDIKATGKKEVFKAVTQFEYYICPQRSIQDNCERKFVSGSTIEINNVPGDRWVWLEYQNRFINIVSWGPGEFTWQVGHEIYGLREYNVLGGSPALLNQGSCKLNTNVGGQIKSEDISSISSPTGTVYSTADVFKVNEVRWYLAGYVTSASDGVDLGDGTWCRDLGSSGAIYKINTVTTDKGTYKIADPQYNNFVKNVECCPGDISGSKRCGNSFKWEETAQSQCSFFNSCGAVDYQPDGANQVSRFACIDGQCKKETKKVECSSDIDCANTLEICDKSSWSCVRADVNLEGDPIIRIPDNLKDCEAEGGTWVREETEKSSILNFFGIGQPKTVVKEYCDLSKPNYLLWIALIVGAILLFFFWRPLLAGFKALFGRFL